MHRHIPLRLAPALDFLVVAWRVWIALFAVWGLAVPAVAQTVSTPVASVADEPAPREGVHLEVHAERPELKLHARRPGQPGVQICGVGCTLTLEPGLYQLGVGVNENSARWVDGVWKLDDSAPAHISYERRAGTRAGGVVLMLAGSLVGVVVTVVGAVLSRVGQIADDASGGDGGTRTDGLVLTGFGLSMIAGALAGGGVLMAKGDRATVRVGSERRSGTTVLNPEDLPAEPGRLQDERVVKDVFSCLPTPMTEISLDAKTDVTGRITSVAVPASLLRGVRSCVRSAVMKARVIPRRRGKWRLVLQR